MRRSFPMRHCRSFVLGQAHKRCGKPALVEADTDRELTYAQLATAVQEAGAGLAARGVHPGDVLALCTPNSIEFVVTWYAASSIGAILTRTSAPVIRPLGSGKLEAELASAPPGDGGVGGQAGVAEDG